MFDSAADVQGNCITGNRRGLRKDERWHRRKRDCDARSRPGTSPTFPLLMIPYGRGAAISPIVR
jgi:hypothetical protein